MTESRRGIPGEGKDAEEREEKPGRDIEKRRGREKRGGGGGKERDGREEEEEEQATQCKGSGVAATEGQPLGLAR